MQLARPLSEKPSRQRWPDTMAGFLFRVSGLHPLHAYDTHRSVLHRRTAGRIGQPGRGRTSWMCLIESVGENCIGSCSSTSMCVWCGWVPGRGFAVHWNWYCSASGCNIHDSAYVVPGAWGFCMSVGVGSGRRGRGPSGLSFGYLPHRDAHNVHDNSSMHCGLCE